VLSLVLREILLEGFAMRSGVVVVGRPVLDEMEGRVVPGKAKKAKQVKTLGKPSLPDDADWPDSTVTWFNAWCDSSRTDSFDATQWQYMFDTALVHASVWGSGNFAMLGELRARLTAMGLVFESSAQAGDGGKETLLDVLVEEYASRLPGAANKGRAKAKRNTR
jgi:hypothetical protein